MKQIVIQYILMKTDRFSVYINGNRSLFSIYYWKKIVNRYIFMEKIVNMYLYINGTDC